MLAIASVMASFVYLSCAYNVHAAKASGQNEVPFDRDVSK